jgi:hypothetical protein
MMNDECRVEIGYFRRDATYERELKGHCQMTDIIPGNLRM